MATKKRRREHVDQVQRQMHFLKMLESYVTLQLLLYSRWYIWPRCMDYNYLFLDYLPLDEPSTFRQRFRISPEFVEFLCWKIHEDMATRPTNALMYLQNCKLLVQRQVAIALCRLCTRDSTYGGWGIIWSFNCHCFQWTWKFVKAMNKNFRDVITWPTNSKMKDIKSSFAAKHLYNYCGAMDATHILIDLPHDIDSVNFYDYKKNIFVLMQAIVN